MKTANRIVIILNSTVLLIGVAFFASHSRFWDQARDYVALSLPLFFLTLLGIVVVYARSRKLADSLPSILERCITGSLLVVDAMLFLLLGAGQ